VARRYPHPFIAREGWPFVLIALAVALLVGYFVGWWWSVPIWLAAIRARCCRRPTGAWWR
jgi:phosphatidylserine decarboxylase